MQHCRVTCQECIHALRHYSIFKGLIFETDENSNFEVILKVILSEIRFSKGRFTNVLSKIPSDIHAYTFNHSRSENESVSCEQALFNALKKLGIRFTKVR